MNSSDDNAWSDAWASQEDAGKHYRRYSGARLFFEALAYTSGAVLLRFLVRTWYPDPQAQWLNFVSVVLQVATLIFGVLSALASPYVVLPIVANVLSVIGQFVRVLLAPFLPPPYGIRATPDAKSGSVPRTSQGANSDSEHEIAAGPRVVTRGPPAMASFILQLVLPERDRATLIGDLDQAYDRDLLPTYGKRAAGFWYWMRCVREVAFYSWPFLKKVLPWGAMLAVISDGRWAWFASFVRRLLGN